MTQQHFENAQELIDAFGISNNEKYSRITPLNDRKVGFSVQREYPKDILYSPLVNGNGEDDTVVLIHVVYAHPDEIKTEFDSHKVPIIVRAVTHSRYRVDHFDYDFNDPNSPTKESIEKTKATPMPVALDFDNEFFFDHHSGTFLDHTHEPLSGEQILEIVYKAHCDTAHRKRGRIIRAKLKYQSFASAFFGVIINILISILTKLFGRTLDDNETSSGYYRGYQRKNLKKLSTESLDVFGYKTARSVIILFCLIAAVAFFIKYQFGIQTPYLSKVFSDSFLALTHSLILLWFLDVVMPLILFHIINFLIKTRTNISFKKFKV
jgi:hypothetical protein